MTSTQDPDDDDNTPPVPPPMVTGGVFGQYTSSPTIGGNTTWTGNLAAFVSNYAGLPASNSARFYSKEFSGPPPLVAGTIFGMRTWRIKDDGSGLLTGFSYKQEWLPGENQAICMGGGYFPTPLNPFGSAPAVMSRSFSVEEGVTVDEHHVAHINCQCGFWAYTHVSPTNPFVISNNFLTHNLKEALVAGVIEAYGKVTVGSLGFRASKAKIRALILPDMPVKFSDKTWAEMDVLERWEHRKNCRDSMGTHYGSSQGNMFRSLAVDCTLFPEHPVRKTLSIRKMYPDVQFFPNATKLLEAFPVSHPPTKELE